MYIKFLISLILPIFYIIFRNHNEIIKIEQNNLSLKKIKLYYPDLVFPIPLLFSLFSSFTITMNLWVICYMVLASIYVKTKKVNDEVKKKTFYMRRVWRLDLIYILCISYIVFLFQEENMIFYYLLLGTLIYLQNIIIIFIHQMVLQMENYKNRSEKYEN